MQISLNGEIKIVPKGTILSTVLPHHPIGCGVVILRPWVAAPTAMRDFGLHLDAPSLRFITTAGDIVVELLPGAVMPVPIGGTSDINLRVHWEDKYVAAFGPFKVKSIPDCPPNYYDRGILYLGCGGYDLGASYLMFSRCRHVRDPKSMRGVILGTVISGLNVVNKWRSGDLITKIEYIPPPVDKTNAIVTTNLSLMVEDGMHIFSEICIIAEGYRGNHAEIDVSCTRSVEHLLFALRNSEYLIDRVASTYIRDHTEGQLDVPMELQKSRQEGAVTVRTSGKSSGAIYIYTKDVSGNQYHTRVGTVARGIELARFAGAGTKLSVKTIPDQFDLRGLSLKDAVSRSKAQGIRVFADNLDVEGRVVVNQNPATTLEVLKDGKVDLTTIDLESVINIELDYKHAPRTVDLFRRVTGLKIYSIGNMPFFYNVDNEMYLFKPGFSSHINIIPENVPNQPVPPYSLAITNDSRKARGIVGVRSVDNEEYGPTGEPFEGTNVIGVVLDIKKLSLIKDGSDVFIREVKL